MAFLSHKNSYYMISSISSRRPERSKVMVHSYRSIVCYSGGASSFWLWLLQCCRYRLLWFHHQLPPGCHYHNIASSPSATPLAFGICRHGNLEKCFQLLPDQLPRLSYNLYGAVLSPSKGKDILVRTEWRDSVVWLAHLSHHLCKGVIMLKLYRSLHKLSPLFVKYHHLLYWSRSQPQQPASYSCPAPGIVPAELHISPYFMTRLRS